MKINFNNKIVLFVAFIFYFLIDWLLLSFLSVNPFIIFGFQLCLGLVCFSPIGTIIVRFLYDCQPVLTVEDKKRLLPIFEEVLQNAKSEVPDLNPNIRLYIDNSQQVNAFALGSNTVAITRGAILQLSDEQIKGILSHEIGHIVHGDTFLGVFFLAGNSIFLLLFMFFNFVKWFFGNVQGVLEVEKVRPGIIRIFIASVVTVCLLVVEVMLKVNERFNEKQADIFALHLGYGDELVSSLYLLSSQTIGKKQTVMEKVKASHPNIYRRIAFLESRM